MDLDRLRALRQQLTIDLQARDVESAGSLRQLDALLSVISDNDSVATSAGPDVLRETQAEAAGADEPVLDDETIAAAIASLSGDAGEVLSEEGLTLFRREAGIWATLDASDQTALRNAEATLGFQNLRDLFGRDFDIGIFRPAVRLALVPAAGQSPVLLFSSAPEPTAGAQAITINRGSVWIAARLLDPVAAPEGYVGLSVEGGRLELETAISLDGNDAVLGAAFSGTLSLRLRRVSGNAPRFEGGPPEDLSIRFRGGGAPEQEISDGKARADGVVIGFKADGTLRHDPMGDRIVFGCAVDPDTLDTTAFDLEEATFSGSTRLVDGGWSVPITQTSTPRSLPEAMGTSFWTVHFADPVGVRWKGGPAGKAKLEDARLSIGATCFLIETASAKPATVADVHTFALWRLPSLGHRAKVSIALGSTFPAAFGCTGSGDELVRFAGLFDATLGRPADATGAPIPAAAEPVIVRMTGPSDQRELRITPQDPSRGLPFDRRMLVLENAFLSVGTLRLSSIAGSLRDGRDVSKATAALSVPVHGWIPTLPDPYVDNLSVDEDDFLRRSPISTLIATFRWSTGAAEFSFEGVLPGPTSGKADASQEDPRPSIKADLAPRYRSQTDQAAQIPSRGRFDFPPVAVPEPQTPPAGRPADPTVEAVRNFEGQIGELGLGRGGCMLLDVSTARHQIGVQIAPRQNVTVGAALIVQGMQIGAPLASLRVFALPQIQWEPVRTLPKDQDPVTLGIFPTPLASADDGGPTILASNAAVLAPVLPELTLNSQITELGAGERMNVLSTLPFGMRMLMRLRPPGFDRDAVDYVRPVFSRERPLEGALQVSLRSEAIIRRAVDDQSAAFEGWTVQVPNGVDLDTGNPLDISVLGATVGSEGSVETLFNQEFGGANPRVPVTRYDISGYGASTFSDWANPKGSFAETTRVNFRVVVGRTLLEIVKVASVLYPWGIRVTRSVTIERRGGGGVVRRDSGWQAQTPGLFDFTTDTVTTQPYEIHPGLIRGIYDIDRIRPVGEELTLPGTGRVLPMAFDAMVQIEGSPDRTRAEGLVGFLHLAHQTPLPPGPGQPLSTADLAALVQFQEGIGGPVDAEIEIGQSGFRARATRIEVRLAERAGKPIFVGAVRTMPVFGPSGSWSVVRGPGSPSGSAQDVAAVTDGAPVVRAGPALPATGFAVNATGSGPYLIAEASDLFSGSTPEFEYGLMQADSTHRFLFRRPEITAGQPWITSPVPPAFADFYAAATTKGLFPPIANAIELVDAPYRLGINGDGLLRLDPDVNFQAPRSDLVLSETASDRLRVSYDNAQLMFKLGAEDWELEFPGLEIWSELTDLPNMTGCRAIVRAGSNQRAQLDEVEILLSPVLENILSVMPFHNERGKVGPIDLGVSNLKVTPKLSVGLDYFFPQKGADVIAAIRLSALIEIGIENELGVTDEALFIGIRDLFEARVSIPVKPYPVAIMFGFSALYGTKVLLTGPDAGKGKTLVEVRVYIGLAFGEKLGPFQAAFATGFGLLLVWGEKSGLGGFVFIEIKVNLAEMVKLKIFGEFAALQVEDSSGRKFERYQGFVGVNVSLFMVFSIKFTVEISDEKEIPPPTPPGP
ncbi:MAG: hypothetical protein AAGF76_03575 [Pseudomonadota bacterium]